MNDLFLFKNMFFIIKKLHFFRCNSKRYILCMLYLELKNVFTLHFERGFAVLYQLRLQCLLIRDSQNVISNKIIIFSALPIINYHFTYNIQVQKKRRIIGRVQCRNIKNDCPKSNCEEPILLPGKCCKSCPGEDASKIFCLYIIS